MIGQRAMDGAVARMRKLLEPALNNLAERLNRGKNEIAALRERLEVVESTAKRSRRCVGRFAPRLDVFVIKFR